MIPNGHSQVFLEWVLTYDSILWKIARSYASAGEHNDLHQDLLIALWHAAPLYRDQAKPSTFIYRVALNCALNWSRNRVRYHRRHVEFDETAQDFAVHPDEHASQQERRVELLYAALAALPEADRSLALLHLDGLNYREIAEILGITENNVGVKLNRVRKRLAEQLRQTEKHHES